MDEIVTEAELQEIDNVIDGICEQVNVPDCGLCGDLFEPASVETDEQQDSEDPFETIEELRKELSSLHEIVVLLKKMY